VTEGHLAHKTTLCFCSPKGSVFGINGKRTGSKAG